LRDDFLKKVSSVYSPNEVQVIAHQQNRWNYGTPEDRFREMMAHKVIICNPIYNDVPARLFDALVVGAIPIVPHGLPELNRCFSRQELAELPVISYIPDSLSSVGAAIQRGVESFDSGGAAGIAKRHRVAMDHHFVHHRVAEMISESVNLAKQC
jgi:hypothetical protein